MLGQSRWLILLGQESSNLLPILHLPKLQCPRTFNVKDIGHAPIVYFDGVTNFGCNNGVVNVTLGANRYLPDSGSGVIGDVIVVSHLRCTVAAAMDLRAALDKALLIGAPTDGQIN